MIFKTHCTLVDYNMISLQKQLEALMSNRCVSKACVCIFKLKMHAFCFNMFFSFYILLILRPVKRIAIAVSIFPFSRKDANVA